MNEIEKKETVESRRNFLKMAAALPLAARFGGLGSSEASAQSTQGDAPWYQRTYRWGQINLNELDPQHFDLQWWRGDWQRSQTQGMVINAGGIVAYYPSKEPLQHQG